MNKLNLPLAGFRFGSCFTADLISAVIRGITVCAIFCFAGFCHQAAAEGSWAFEPRESDHPALDLRSLNEPVAGQTGFIRTSEDGTGFASGDGKSIRFWPVQTAVTAFQNEDGDRHARWLARLGVNLARLGGGTLNPKTGTPDQINEAALDLTWRGVAALKKQGIYSLVMPYWVAKGADVTEWGIDGYTGTKAELWGLLFFNPKLQEAYRGWLKQLMTRPNPYTGIPLAQDPAIAVILLQNEDSLLFFTVSAMKAPQQKILGERFAQWTTKRYGSPEKAVASWQGATVLGDDLASGVLGLYPIYEATLEQSGGKEARVRDQVQFFTEIMREFNEQTAKYLREELGCKQLIAAENWRTANESKLLDCEHYAYSANDVIAKNHYFTGVHEGPTKGYLIKPGDMFTNRSVLTSPWAFPVNTKQVVGHPHIITESAWVNPNLYQSEAPFLVAAYRSLTGQAGLFWFAVGRTPEFENVMTKWGAATPMTAAQWPAAALLYRKGYVKQGATVVHEERPLEDLWSRKVPLLWEEMGYDPNRDSEMAESTGADSKTDPLAFLVGRIEVAYGGDSTKTKVLDLKPYIDRAAKTVRSITSEIALDYGTGICRLDTAKAQGACGFLGKSGKIPLSTVTIDSQNAYASILAVAMDDLPLAQSRKILIQIGTTARPAGWATEPSEVKPKNWKAAVAGERIVSVGKGPWQIEPSQATIEIANPGLVKAVLLDGGGAIVRDVPMEKANNGCRIVLPGESMHLIVTANETL